MAVGGENDGNASRAIRRLLASLLHFSDVKYITLPNVMERDRAAMSLILRLRTMGAESRWEGRFGNS